MSKLFFWKGSTHLGVPVKSNGSGSTYSSWQSATNITNLQNWYSLADGEDAVKGATALPTLTDKVYISDRCPNLGTRRQYIGKDNYSSATSSPCINSSGATLSALSVDIGPFVGSKSVPKNKWMITKWRSTFVGRPLSEKLNPDNLLLSTGSSIVGLDKTYKTYYETYFGYDGGGNELNINSSNITILDSNLGTYDITIVPSLVNSVSRVQVQESAIGEIKRISHWTHPWKKETSIKLGENSNASFIGVSAGIYVNQLSIGSGTILTTVGGVSGATASNLQGGGGTYATPNVVLEGQIDNFIIQPSSTTNIKHVRISPIVVCNETISNYYFETSVLRVGNTKNLSPQEDPAFADIILENSRWFESNSRVPISNYGVILGSSVWKKAQDYKTQFKFSTSLKSATSTEQIRKFFTGSPSVYLRGNSVIQDFILNTGQITLDYNNISTNYGVLCGNGKITSDGTVLFESQIKCSSSEQYPLCMGQWGITYSVGTTQYGIQIDSTNPYPIKYPKNSIIRSHISPWISPPVGGVADMETGVVGIGKFTESLNNCNRRENNDLFPKGMNPAVLNPSDHNNDGDVCAMDVYMSTGANVVDDFLNSLQLDANSYWGGTEHGDGTYNPIFAKDIFYQYNLARADQDQLIGGAEPYDLLWQVTHPLQDKPGSIDDGSVDRPFSADPSPPFDLPYDRDTYVFNCERARNVGNHLQDAGLINRDGWSFRSYEYGPYGPFQKYGKRCLPTMSCDQCRAIWEVWHLQQEMCNQIALTKSTLQLCGVYSCGNTGGAGGGGAGGGVGGQTQPLLICTGVFDSNNTPLLVPEPPPDFRKLVLPPGQEWLRWWYLEGNALNNGTIRGGVQFMTGWGLCQVGVEVIGVMDLLEHRINTALPSQRPGDVRSPIQPGPTGPGPRPIPEPRVPPGGGDPTQNPGDGTPQFFPPDSPGNLPSDPSEWFFDNPGPPPQSPNEPPPAINPPRRF